MSSVATVAVPIRATTSASILFPALMLYTPF